MIQVNSTVAPLYLRPVLTLPPDTVPDPVLVPVHDTPDVHSSEKCQEEALDALAVIVKQMV
jgi:hypothetical protein